MPQRRRSLRAIFIHGGSQSIGCLAIGDEAVQELFLLLAIAKPDRVRVLLCPNDLRRSNPVTPEESMTLSLRERYAELLDALPGKSNDD